MPSELDKILISYDQPDFDECFTKIRVAAFGVAHGLSGTDKKALDKILSEVYLRKDNAVSEFTEKFDNVKLSPKQFRITEKELQKAKCPGQSGLWHLLAKMGLKSRRK